MLEPTQSVEPPSLTIITNWTNLLKKWGNTDVPIPLPDPRSFGSYR